MVEWSGAMEGVVRGDDGVARCWWADAAPEYRAYHDGEWGFPVAHDVRLFEKLSLEGFQAGLSWLTILRKRPAFREAFAGFDPDRVAGFGEADVARLLADAGIVRHRGKIEASIANARATVALRETDELCVCDLAWIVERAENLVSHHLRALRAAGLAEYRRDGKMALYSLTERGHALLEALASQRVAP